ncbi:UNKNOWN [Stylonychia lemnae]|uniref:Centrosomal protein POC5 n=1 Tax=Stylonychia lemnae TaxID=5949 RepID=A0A078BA46_STYLE|nr:UNKNOWN [Stylonychia lemnae]|eukprot:CDW91294.1 UNKNOWN [Stylonychia lemnae]
MKQNINSSAATNPLRISHESLDLDDIISDLNEGNFRPPQQQEQQVTSSTNRTNDTNTTGNNKQQTGLKSKATASSSTLVKTQSKAKITNNKENNSKVTNQNKKELMVNGTQAAIIDSKYSVVGNISTQIESDRKQKDYLISTTSESQSEARLQGMQQQIEEVKYSDRHHGIEDQHSINQNLRYQQPTSNNMDSAPFYLNRGNISQASSITDEDVESFQKKLDTLIINFRSETMSEFMRTKKQVLQEQSQTIDAERRRCNTLLGVKQNEIEQLKENLGQKTKLCDELGIRCEIMALWAGKGKTLARMKVLQFKCFNALKQYREFKKHSKNVLKHKLEQYRENTKRKVFLGWEKQYKEWKIIKNRDDFEKAVKTELQQICAQYSKEIESLRQKLDEANGVVEQENKNKAMMSENLKKAFMRGVCALNFEAMNILNPNDVNYQSQIEKEMEKQVMFAMNDISSNTNQQFNSQLQNQQQYPSMNQRVIETNRSPQQNINTQFQSRTVDQSFQNSNSYQYSQSDINDQYQSERKFMQIDNNSDIEYKKVETKDSQWKPAPIMGREITQSINTQQFNQYNQQPQITQMLKQQQQPQQNFVLPSHFNRLNNGGTQGIGMPQFTDTYNGQMNLQSEGQALSEDKVLYNQQLNYQSSSLPDFVNQSNNTIIGNSSSLPQVNVTGNSNSQTEGKTIYAAGVNQTQSQNAKSNISKSVSVNQTTKKGTVTSTIGKNNSKASK